MRTGDSSRYTPKFQDKQTEYVPSGEINYKKIIEGPENTSKVKFVEYIFI